MKERILLKNKVYLVPAKIIKSASRSVYYDCNYRCIKKLNEYETIKLVKPKKNESVDKD